MNKKILFISLLTLCTMNASAQHRKLAFFELGGSSIFGSANYEMRFSRNVNDGWGARFGFGGTFGAFDTGRIYTAPIGINYIYGEGNNGLLIGANSVFAFNGEGEKKPSDFKSVIFSADVGYRYSPKDNGLSFQATYTPLFNTIDGNMPFWIGAGIGYSWK